MAASEGNDFVLVGPPGTGKSQTIANIISQCLATGKTLLFVAEKTAALDVVYRRLREHGLGDCCIELHSNKAERRHFLEQLEASWNNNRRPTQHEWLNVSERLQVRRDELNSYVAAVHAVHPNGWTAFRAMGVSVKGEKVWAPQLKWAATVQHNKAAYDNLTRTITDLALVFQSIDRKALLPQVTATDWSAAWETTLLQNAAQLKIAATALLAEIKKLTTAIGMHDIADCSIDELSRLNRLAQALLKSADVDVSVLFNKQFAKLSGAQIDLQSAIERLKKARDSASGTYNPDTLDQIAVDDLDRRWREAKASIWPLSWVRKRKVTRLLQSYAIEGAANPDSDLRAIRDMLTHRSAITASPLAGLTPHWREDHTDTLHLESHLKLAAEVREAIIGIGQPAGRTNEISKTLYPALKDDSGQMAICTIVCEYLNSSAQFTSAWRAFAKTAGSRPVGKESSSIVSNAIAVADRVQANRAHLKQWTAWCEIRNRAESLGLTPFIDALQAGETKPSDIADRFELAYARWWLPNIIDVNIALRVFQRFKHEDAIEDFSKLDDLARSTATSRVRQAIAHDLPQTDKVPRKSELGLLRHQIGLKRPSKSIRQVIGGMPESFGKLAPCLLMSPLSIAQYLPADHALFDVVVFDEASQITTWDAIGAIARGRQTIIVGDPKQLPPTNFFGREDDDEDNEDLDDFEKDLESILDEAQASGMPTLQLNWHYRSRHESLIAFSNWNYYGNKLITFPAAEAAQRGVSLRYVPNALFDRGKSRTNRTEAEAIVADAVARMKRCLAKPEKERLTYGVITFNVQQQTLIQDLFDQAQRDHPELEWFFSDDRIEPTAVKNLENVQGDERDVMFFSITFGFDAAGKFPVNFGALNRDGGERRLNVAVTRARQSLIVYSSFRAEQFRAERSQARGVHDLKSFLEYAEKGPSAILARTEGSVSSCDSPFEEAVADALASRGRQVEPQIGVSGFRVDLGIVHPDKPGNYLAGIECDGATYHRSAAARDRDKTRQQVLVNLGWNIVRVWSPDWWYDSKSAIERVHNALVEILEMERLTATLDQQTEAIETAWAPNAEGDSKSLEETSTEQSHAKHADTPFHGEAREPLIAHQVVPRSLKMYYQKAELPDSCRHQDRIFDEDYSTELRAMAMAILELESPIRDDVLAREIARAHGFARMGTRLRQRILDVVSDAAFTEETTGRFLWNCKGPLATVPFRYAHNDEERRSIDEISIAELLGLIESNPNVLNEDDPAIACARELGIARLAQSARRRLEEAIVRALTGRGLTISSSDSQP
jgi:very-short-patch-repair endonuclease